MNMGMESSRPGFTLLEILAAVVVMSIISAVVLPVIMSASESYTTTREVRNSTERMAYALERASRVIREAPIGAGNVGLGVQSASSESLEFTDGTGFELDGTDLMLLVPGQNPAKLCVDIDSLSISYLASDGLTNTLATPTETHRVAVTLTNGNLQMSVVTHPRVWIGQQGGSE